MIGWTHIVHRVETTDQINDDHACRWQPGSVIGLRWGQFNLRLYHVFLSVWAATLLVTVVTVSVDGTGCIRGQEKNVVAVAVYYWSIHKKITEALQTVQHLHLSSPSDVTAETLRGADHKSDLPGRRLLSRKFWLEVMFSLRKWCIRFRANLLHTVFECI